MSFTARAKLTVTAKSDGAVDGLLLAGDREVRFGLALESKQGCFALILKDGEKTTRLGSLPARELDAGALKAWTSGEMTLEARVKPCADDPRRCEVVFACRSFTSAPIRLANSIWQGVKIGAAAELVNPKVRNWIDLTSCIF